MLPDIKIKCTPADLLWDETLCCRAVRQLFFNEAVILSVMWMQDVFFSYSGDNIEFNSYGDQ